MSSKLKKLGSLADIYQSENLDGTITRIKLDRIHPSEEQPRKDARFGVDELAASIKKDGLLSPIVVTREGENYRIIAGERRFHAVSKLGWVDAECRIISREERDYWRIAIVENLQREDLPAEDEAAALLKLKKQENLSDAALAALVGKSRNYITEILSIAALPDTVLRECQYAKIDNKNMLIQVAQAHKNGNWKEFLAAYKRGEVRTVRAAKDFVQTSKSQPDLPIGKKPPGQTGARPEPSNDYQIRQTGSEVRVRCPDPAAAKKLEAFLIKRYSKK